MSGLDRLTLTAAVKASNAKVNAPTKDVATGSPSDYVPCVGDVVEFEYLGVMTRGIIGPFHGKTDPTAIWGLYPGNNDRPAWTSIPDKVINKVDFIGGLSDVESVKDALKAYFSKPAPPVFEGSYAERQKQAVKHYGWKVGSKVKVVRKVERSDGWSNTWVGSMDKYIGESCGIRRIEGHTLVLDNGWNFPYFALEPVKGDDMETNW